MTSHWKLEKWLLEVLDLKSSHRYWRQTSAAQWFLVYFMQSLIKPMAIVFFCFRSFQIHLRFTKRAMDLKTSSHSFHSHGLPSLQLTIWLKQLLWAIPSDLVSDSLKVISLQIALCSEQLSSTTNKTIVKNCGVMYLRQTMLYKLMFDIGDDAYLYRSSLASFMVIILQTSWLRHWPDSSWLRHQLAKWYTILAMTNSNHSCWITISWTLFTWLIHVHLNRNTW